MPVLPDRVLFLNESVPGHVIDTSIRKEVLSVVPDWLFDSNINVQDYDYDIVWTFSG